MTQRYLTNGQGEIVGEITATLSLLDDVDVTGTGDPGIGDVLVFNGSFWQNQDGTTVGSDICKFQTTEPTSPEDGDAWLNTSNGQLFVYQNGAWNNVVFKQEAASDTGDITLNAGYF